MFQLTSKKRTLALYSPQVMGILNTTPDSFSDGGQYHQFDAACLQAREMIAAGASIIDIGGESTRPGAQAVSVEQELARVIPLVEYIAANFDVWISLDTSKPEVMQAGIDAGAHMINDVRALQESGALAMAAKLDVPVCLMHMQGQPRTMQMAPEYDDVIVDIKQFLQDRVDACLAAGIKKQQLILDPGFGFGKTLAHNYELLGRLNEFSWLGLPVLAGLSRKSMFGQLLERDVTDRLPASLAGALISIQQGAQIVRVHDVQQTMDVVRVWQATETYIR